MGGPDTANWKNQLAQGEECQEDHQGPPRGASNPKGKKGNSSDHPGQSDWTSTNSRNLAQKYFHIRIATGISERFLNISQLSGFSVTS